MNRMVVALSHPVGPIVGILTAFLVVISHPDQLMGWVIGVSSLAWLAAAYRLRTQFPRTSSPVPETRTRSEQGTRLLAGMIVGTAVGGLVTVAAGTIGIAVGMVASAITVIAMQQRGPAIQRLQTPASPLPESAIAAAGVALGLGVWLLATAPR